MLTGKLRCCQAYLGYVNQRLCCDQLIEKNTTIPTRASETFSTAEDNQAAVTVHVLQGQREMAVNGNDKAAIEMRQKALQETYSKIMQAEQTKSQ